MKCNYCNREYSDEEAERELSLLGEAIHHQALTTKFSGSAEEEPKSGRLCQFSRSGHDNTVDAVSLSVAYDMAVRRYIKLVAELTDFCESDIRHAYNCYMEDRRE